MPAQRNLSHSARSIALSALLLLTPSASQSGEPAGHEAATGEDVAVTAPPDPGTPVATELESERQDALASTDTYIQKLIDSLSEQAAEAVALSLRDAVGSAIANNPGMRADRRVPEAEQHRVIEAASAFEPVIAIDANYFRAKEPTADALSGVDGLAGEAREDDRYRADFSIRKMFRTGTQLGLNWRNSRATTNSSFQQLSPNFEPSVGVQLRQPLLRDLGGVVANTNVRIAKETSQSAAADFEEQLSDFVYEVVAAYWDHVLAEAELEVQRHSHRLAAELAAEAQKRVDVGSLPPVAAQEALADAAAREEEVIEAERELNFAARKLQYMVMFRATENGIPRAIVPADDHGVIDQAIDRAQSLKTAITRRARVRAARVELATTKLRERRAHTDLLPSLELVGNYELVGLGGVNESKLPDEEDAFGNSLDVLSSGDFYRYSVGLELEVPLSNAAARARHTRASIETKRQEEALRQTVAEVALEVDAGAGDLAAAYKRVAVANLSRELAQENLRQQQRRYEVGKITTTDVLDFQEKLADAMAAEARAITDHAKASADARRAEGTLLEYFAVQVSFDDAPEIPWWAKF